MNYQEKMKQRRYNEEELRIRKRKKRLNIEDSEIKNDDNPVNERYDSDGEEYKDVTAGSFIQTGVSLIVSVAIGMIIVHNIKYTLAETVNSTMLNPSSIMVDNIGTFLPFLLLFPIGIVFIIYKIKKFRV